MVKTIGLRQLSRAEIYEVIFENDSIQLEQSILNDFVYHTKENNMAFLDIINLIKLKTETLLGNSVLNFKINN